MDEYSVSGPARLRTTSWRLLGQKGGKVIKPLTDTEEDVGNERTKTCLAMVGPRRRRTRWSCLTEGIVTKASGIGMAVENEIGTEFGVRSRRNMRHSVTTSVSVA